VTSREAHRVVGESAVGAATDAAGGVSLYPLLFAPILQYRLWGGRRLPDLLPAAQAGHGPIG
jgi:hypothetical protein